MFARLTRFALLATALLAAPLVHADDTEIYLGANLEQEVKPNVLFIIDTSGSMVYNTLFVTDYDKDTSYTGACDPNKLYWSGDGTLPSCAGSKWFYMDHTKNTCKASWTALEERGFYNSSFGMWRSADKQWIQPDTAGQNWMIDCSDDYSNHGYTAGDGRTYPTQGSTTGWNSSRDRRKTIRFSWGMTVYSGNYLNYRNQGGIAGTEMTRLALVQKVLSELLDTIDGVNVGIMRFDRSTASNGGYMLSPMLELNDENRATLKSLIATGMDNNYNTPLAETLYEAGLFFKGAAPYYGRTTSHSATIRDGRYISPIKYQCQKNFIVYFSDGGPTSDDDADSNISLQPGFSSLTNACRFYSGNDCVDEQAQYLYKADLSATLNDRQNVITYAIGFFENSTNPVDAAGIAQMTAVATKGGGFYKTANDANSVADAFNEIMTNILAVNTTFTAPAVTVNAFNRLTHLDEIYYAVFRPSTQPKWDGNVKRYRLAKAPSQSYLALLDKNGDEAIDNNTGFFKSTSTSYWGETGVVDGDAVDKGGAAAKMPLPRNAYTCCFGGDKDLTSSVNRLHETNSSTLTAALLGASSEDERVKIVKWARGVDVNDSDSDGNMEDARAQMGDPLHTEPLLITYGKRADNSADMTLYATTNEGFLHALDTSTGIEQFSFIPQELLGKLKALVENDSSTSHPYALDGPLTAWVYDKDSDGTIEPGDDHVYLYLTMLRGGKYVYALDVTDRGNPSLMWKIEGGTGAFAELSQTFSKPIVSRVMFNGDPRTVLFFGGGYDPGQDGYEAANVDGTGRAIFMVDATTGDYLWSAGNPETTADLKLADMDYSIPSEVRVVDVDGDRYSDRIYVGDMHAQMWRVDINKLNSGPADFATAGVIAKLGGATEAENRRFYYPPSVSMSAVGNYINIAIGSGFRGHPLVTDNHDRLYVLRDRNVEKAATDGSGNAVYPLLTNLVDATTWVTTDLVDKTLLGGSDGFYIDLRQPDGSWIGEKCLAQGLTMNGAVIFTTYTPVAASQADACAPSQGTAKMYIFSVEDSTAFVGTERTTLLTHGGIPPRPIAVTVPDGSAIIVGTNVRPPNGMEPQLKKSNWRRN